MRSPRLKKLCSTSFHFSLQFCGLALVLAACSGVAQAGVSITPEIDPGSMTSALALLSGGVLLVADRFRRHSR